MLDVINAHAQVNYQIRKLAVVLLRRKLLSPGDSDNIITHFLDYESVSTNYLKILVDHLLDSMQNFLNVKEEQSIYILLKLCDTVGEFMATILDCSENQEDWQYFSTAVSPILQFCLYLVNIENMNKIEMNIGLVISKYIVVHLMVYSHERQQQQCYTCEVLEYIWEYSFSKMKIDRKGSTYSLPIQTLDLIINVAKQQNEPSPTELHKVKLLSLLQAFEKHSGNSKDEKCLCNNIVEFYFVLLHNYTSNSHTDSQHCKEIISMVSVYYQS